MAPTLQALENKEDPQTDRRTAQKLKRGQIAFEAKIDLHGLYREQAKTRLIGFIEQSYHAGMRCVLVITGKGKLILDGEKADENTPGVIRRNFQNWIKEAPLKSYILSVEKAQIRHGGAGAFYVLLKRKRR
ncbi:MAG: Smr/MutS family protein [Alphaproteobacteria bacterium]